MNNDIWNNFNSRNMSFYSNNIPTTLLILLLWIHLLVLLYQKVRYLLPKKLKHRSPVSRCNFLKILLKKE